MNRAPDLQLVFEVRIGAQLPEVAEQLAGVASALMVTCKAAFNENDLYAQPGQSADAVLRGFERDKEFKRKAKEALTASRRK